MIHADAVSIQRRRIGIAGIELRQPRCDGTAIGNRICVQIRLHRRRCLLPRRRVWDGGRLRHGLAQPQPLVREEEEGLIFQDRAAEHATKVILALGRFRQMIEVREPILGVQYVVAEIAE